ncbi:2817_t:CDS:2 [Funneliformis geosporum]|uniref:12869_t:CDS:1 n=1 Tax=Funneliformis geosporum TaxID=1117311 RepID=A0A9W4WVW7_9GLOM|nr:2817_t:CDS:2 [Funneliformis geosporum]CAI2182986.1 12869_t:CDS:2 [Funneliformis geosporum]
MFATTFEHNETAYGFNLRGFQAFVPDAFGSDPAQMERYYNEIYVNGPDSRFPISPAAIAGAAAYKAVRSQPPTTPFYGDLQTLHLQAISNIKSMAAQEAQNLLARFCLPNIDPMIVIISAEAAAHRLYDHENFD